MPAQPRDPHQPRPVLVISHDRQNRWGNTVIAVPIFSRGTPDLMHLPIARGVGGLPHDSVLFCDNVSAVDKRLVVEGPYGRPVPDALLDQVVLGVRRAIGDVI